MSMKKDLEYQGQQIDLIKADNTDYVKNHQIETIINVVKKDQTMYTDEMIK